MNHLPCKPSDVVWVVWKDAVGDSTRCQADAISSVTLVTNTNLGWIIHETAEAVTLAHGVSGSGEIDLFCIPRNCIVEIIPVRKGRK